MPIIPLPKSRKKWLELRKKYIGGSEIAALLGIQADYQLSPMALYLIKRGEIEAPDIDNVRIKWGNRLEDVIAHAACEEMGWKLQKGVYAIDDTTPGMASSLDRVIMPSEKDLADGYEGPGDLEIKNVDGRAYRDKWDGDEPPPFILAQHQHQLACSGYQWGAVAALVGGNDLHVIRYRQNSQIISAIREAVTDFWIRVKEGRAPPPDGYDSTTDALKRKYPTLQELTLDLTTDNQLPELCIELKGLVDQRKKIAYREEEIKNELRVRVGSAKFATVAGGIRISRTIGDDRPPRPAEPGEIIPGRKGQDRLTVTHPKAA